MGIEKLDISAKSFIDKIQKLSTAVLWDRSYDYAEIITADLKNYTPGLKLAGPCYIVNTYNNILPIIQALQHIPEHYILVINDLGDNTDALLGDIIMTAAKNQNLAGIVALGNIRDVDAAPGIGIPVWAKGTNVKPAKLGAPFQALPKSISINEATLEQNDWIVGDSDGIILIKNSRLRFIVKAAEIKNKKENLFLQKLSKNRISDLMNLPKYLNNEGEITIDF